jgi:hypothetical protein
VSSVEALAELTNVEITLVPTWPERGLATAQFSLLLLARQRHELLAMTRSHCSRGRGRDLCSHGSTSGEGRQQVPLIDRRVQDGRGRAGNCARPQHTSHRRRELLVSETADHTVPAYPEMLSTPRRRATPARSLCPPMAERLEFGHPFTSTAVR